jgi:hypothetical protein
MERQRRNLGDQFQSSVPLLRLFLVRRYGWMRCKVPQISDVACGPVKNASWLLRRVSFFINYVTES